MKLDTAEDAVIWLNTSGYNSAGSALSMELKRRDDIENGDIVIPLNCLLNEEGDGPESECVYDDPHLTLSDCTIADKLSSEGKCKFNCPHYKKS
jgi:hypothetical protein